ncbi:MAG: HesA/MoeB/ThiF family protein [Nanoarchaeota archaeon]|nr:HesA/MoeB/ThiF family protein [Nanoarchaeota archaeon]MCA9497071.1 HesA/MoeB/ThiF family protein [Nanoarchaeota archaeon]
MIYSRQKKFLENLNEYDLKFQDKIEKCKIILVGCGGIGSPLAELLVRGGFLNLVLVDNDLIDETNLQRQVFFENDIGNFKSKSLAKYLKKINSKVNCNVICDILNENNVNSICEGSDLIIDASDNFELRKLVNEYCETNNKNWIYNGAVKSEIITCLFYGEDKLFKKVFPKEINEVSCCEVGVLSSTTFASASLAYNQIIKYFLGIRDYKLIKLDLWKNQIFEIKIK